MGLFRKGKTRITAELHRTDLIICTHSTEGNTPFYSQINTVFWAQHREDGAYPFPFAILSFLDFEIVPHFSAYKTEAFPFQNNPINLDPSYKMDLDL